LTHIVYSAMLRHWQPIQEIKLTRLIPYVSFRVDVIHSQYPPLRPRGRPTVCPH